MRWNLKKNIVIVDDKANILKVLKVILEKKGYQIETFQKASVALKYSVRYKPDLIISDIRMEDMGGREFFYLLKSRGFSIPFVFITAFGNIEDAVSLMKEGAVDYMTKPIDYNSLKNRIDYLLRKSKAGIYESLSEDKVLIGSSVSMQAIYSRINMISDSSSTVLIAGESGTGKELVARAIHKRSRRRNHPFIAVNCSAFNENLLESELFGHEKGAFTDAIRTKSGIFEEANGGTLFLDEASELSLATQAKLLRVLQEKVFTRVGGTNLLRTDVRVIAATNKNLQDLIAAHRFRDDLYYRLNVIPFSIPPLREHTEDIPDLVEYFISRICILEGLTVPDINQSFLLAMKEHQWPGNIRELENIVERILIVHKPEVLEAKHVRGEPEFVNVSSNGKQNERDQIIHALQQCNGNKSEACVQLGISRRTLYYKIERYNIEAFC